MYIALLVPVSIKPGFALLTHHLDHSNTSSAAQLCNCPLQGHNVRRSMEMCGHSNLIIDPELPGTGQAQWSSYKAFREAD